MAKMDESLDFRPFKFRIQAFTNAFLETVRVELLREVLLPEAVILQLTLHGMGEDVVPPKKVDCLFDMPECCSRHCLDRSKPIFGTSSRSSPGSTMMVKSPSQKATTFGIFAHVRIEKTAPGPSVLLNEE